MKNSAKEKIVPDEIKLIKEKSGFGRKGFIIKLKNEKDQDVYEMQNHAEIEKFRKLIDVLRPDLSAKMHKNTSLKS